MTKAKEKISTHSERRVAAVLGGEQTGDNLPVDVHVGRNAIEVKTIINGKNPKITMHPESLDRKMKYARKNKMSLHTVVVDMRGEKPEYFYRKGVGSFRLSSMKPMVSISDIKKELK